MPSDSLRLVVFDCDGTLVDSQHTILAAMAEAWSTLGLEPPPGERIREVIGLTLEAAIGRLALNRDAATLTALSGGYRQAFRRLHARPSHEDPLYPGAVEALDALERSGALLAIATGKGLNGLRATLGQHGLLARFASLQTADSCRGKPDPEMILSAMRDCAAAPESTVMVGDTVHDMRMAVNARVPAIGVSWGYHPVAALREAGAAAIVGSMAELPAAVAALLAA